MVQGSRWPDLKVLVTGGSGFIGWHLCRRLCEEGSEVHATSRSSVRLPGADRSGGTRTWPSSPRHAVCSPRSDLILFFIWQDRSARSPNLELVSSTYQSLLTSSVNVLIGTTEVGCRRIVLTGSLTEPVPGETEPAPQSPYAAAKWAAVGYGRMFHSLYRTPAVILRPFMVYGPAQAASKFIPSVTLSLLRGEAPKVSSGRWKADWVYVGDVIEGFLAAAITSGIDGKSIDLGTGSLVSIRQRR